jgi:hypothetical protein
LRRRHHQQPLTAPSFDAPGHRPGALSLLPRRRIAAAHHLPLITFTDVSKQYGRQVLFVDTSFRAFATSAGELRLRLYHGSGRLVREWHRASAGPC